MILNRAILQHPNVFVCDGPLTELYLFWESDHLLCRWCLRSLCLSPMSSHILFPWLWEGKCYYDLLHWWIIDNIYRGGIFFVFFFFLVLWSPGPLVPWCKDTQCIWGGGAAPSPPTPLQLFHFFKFASSHGHSPSKNTMKTKNKNTRRKK